MMDRRFNPNIKKNGSLKIRNHSRMRKRKSIKKKGDFIRREWEKKIRKKKKTDRKDMGGRGK